MKKLIAMTLCCVMLAGCGGARGSGTSSAASAGTSSTAAASSASSAASASSSASSAASASSSASSSAAASSDSSDALKEAKEATKDFTEHEFNGIRLLVHPDWTIEENESVCKLHTENENISLILGHISGDAIVSDDNQTGIYTSLQSFLGENDKDIELLKFDNGTPYIVYSSDYETDHARSAVFYAKEGLFAFSLQMIGDVDKKEEEQYEKDFRNILAMMSFEEAEYQSMSGEK